MQIRLGLSMIYLKNLCRLLEHNFYKLAITCAWK